ncbi:NADP-dependent oxidoreductase [Kineosporia corallincola]
MKAIRLHRYGGPEVLTLDRVPVPTPGPGEVLVRVHAAGLNPPDWYLRSGMMAELPPEIAPRIDLPMIPGTDVSGVIESIAPDVQGFSVGDEVFGMLRFPALGGNAYAEYVAAPASDLALKPATLDHVHAAGAPMAALTAWQFLIDLGHGRPNPFQPTPHRPVATGPGTTVLVNGAAGGVGHFAVQLAKRQGARVIAVASGPHEAFLRELGADEFIDYTKTAAEDVVRDADLVLDAVGGPSGSRFLRTLKRGGALFPVFFAELDAEETARLGITVSRTQVRASGTQMARLADLFRDDELRVAVDSTFPLADAAQAHERAARGHIRGKIVLDVR